MNFLKDILALLKWHCRYVRNIVGVARLYKTNVKTICRLKAAGVNIRDLKSMALHLTRDPKVTIRTLEAVRGMLIAERSMPDA